MLRGGIWRNQGRFNRALGFRAGQARAYWQPSDVTNPPRSTQEGDDVQGTKTASPAAGRKSWGSSWGPSNLAARPSRDNSEGDDGLLPHERAARAEAARRNSAPVISSEASTPTAQPKKDWRHGGTRPSPSTSGNLSGNSAPHFPRIVPARRPPPPGQSHRTTPGPLKHGSHPSSHPPQGSRRPPPDRPSFRADGNRPRRAGPAPFGSLKAESNVTSTILDSQRPQHTSEESTEGKRSDWAPNATGSKASEWGHLRRRNPAPFSADRTDRLDSLGARLSPGTERSGRRSVPSENRRESSDDPWAAVQKQLTSKESKQTPSDSGNWDWVDDIEKKATNLGRLDRGVKPERDIHARETRWGGSGEASLEGGRKEGSRRRDQFSRSEGGRGLDKRDRREKTKKPQASRQRRNDDADDDFDPELAEEWRRRKAERKAKMEREQKLAAPAGPTPIFLPEFISVSNLAVALGVKQDLFIRQLEELGFEDIGHDNIMTGETAALVAQEYGFEPSVDTGEGVDLRPRPKPEDPSTLPPRPPVVTIMGHVDHGKTTLLDYLRKSSVAAQEHGGITQHIGAFSVQLSTGKRITFLDTPGHAAFLTMRQRGALVTDIVILVVAADDSVKPQTIEALKHARAAKVPIIVAINKVDKDEARIDLVKSDLAKNGVEIEDYGGDVQVVCVSGKTGQGMDDLEENIVTLSEILDMRAETDGMAEGWVLESSVKSIGRVATVLVKRGTLRKGDCIVAGKAWAKIRVLRNEAGVEIEEAPPGTPVEILGWREMPDAGDQVLQAPDEAKARGATHYRAELNEREKAVADIARQEQERREREREQAAAESPEGSSETDSKTKVINFVVKGDVHGSIEAVSAAVMEIGSNEVRPRVLRSATGRITESDVEHAATSGSLIINFNNPIPGQIKRMADDAGVRILDHNIIYHLADDIRDVLSSYLTPEISTRVVGEAEILQVFQINVRGRVYRNVAGCRVRNGQVSRNAKYRVLRRGEKIFEGTIDTLKHGKKEVSEMRKGAECGIAFVDWEDFREGDQIQAFEEISTRRHL